MSKRVEIGHSFHAQHEIVGRGVVSEGGLFIGNILLATNDLHLRAYRLKQQVPRNLTNVLSAPIQNGTFADYLHQAQDAGSSLSISSIFTPENYETDCDEIELDGHSFQPKLDELTQRFDVLDAINALDQEVLDLFVTQLSNGGDAFALIDSKVLVETQRAVAAEQANAGAIVAEIAAREADVDAEAAAALAARGVIQADLAQEIVDRVDDVLVEQVRALAAEGVNAAAVVAETAARGNAITAAIDALVDSAPGTLNTLNELAAALGDDDDYHVAITSSLAGKQGKTVYLDAVDSAQRTTQNLQSLDTTTSIATHLSDEVTARGVAVAGVQSAVDAVEVILGTRTAVQIARVDASSSIQGQFDDEVAARGVAVAGVQSAVDAVEVILGTRTAVQIARVDASSSIQGQFDDEVAARGVAVAAVQSAVDAVEVILGTRTAVQLARVDASSSIQGQLDAKAADAAVVKKTGNQSIAHNSTSAVLTLTNTDSDAPQLTCVGGDGEIRLSGGNVLECDRAGSMYVRASDGSGNVTIQSRGSSKFVCDDKVRLKVETSAEKDFSVENAKKVKFVEASANGSHAISLKAPDSVSADVDFVLPGADGSAGQVLQTDGNGALSFAAGSALSESADESISGEWSFTDLRPKKHAVDTDTTHNTWDSNTGVKRPLGSQDILGKLLIWRPTSSPGHNATWELPTAPAIGTVLWVINANNHNVKYIIVTAGGTDELYKKDLQTAVADGDCKVKIYEQDTFIYVASGVWVYMPQV